MARLDIERQIELEPLRMEYAKEQISALGYEVSEHDGKELRFFHRGKIVKFSLTADGQQERQSKTDEVSANY